MKSLKNSEMRFQAGKLTSRMTESSPDEKEQVGSDGMKEDHLYQAYYCFHQRNASRNGKEKLDLLEGYPPLMLIFVF